MLRLKLLFQGSWLPRSSTLDGVNALAILENIVGTICRDQLCIRASYIEIDVECHAVLSVHAYAVMSISL